MRKVRAQIQEQHKNLSLDEQNKMILGVGRKMAELTVKAMAMDTNAMEKVITAALRESSNEKKNNHDTRNEVMSNESNLSSMPLTQSISDIFNMRQRELAEAPVSISNFQTMLAKRDRSSMGTDAQGGQIKSLALFLCNELNSNAPLSTPILAFVAQVNNARVLGSTTEEWTLNAWKEEFSNYNARTPRGMNSVIMGLTTLHQQNPSLALAARPDAKGMTELVHTVANSSLVEELRNVPSTAQGNVVRALFQGDYDGARSEVLKHRDLANTRTVVMGANLDTTDLDAAGFSM